MRVFASALLIAVVAAFHTVVPTEAQAALGLFSVVRTFYNRRLQPQVPTWTVSFPAATAYVGITTPNPRFTVPQSVILTTQGYNRCVPGTCIYGYPDSKGWYSYWNLRGSFRPNNSYAPTMPVTVRFPTTMFNPNRPPLGKGDPVTPTTTFGGRYDFSRGGSIMITPGKNRFGGTMQFFYGPNYLSYQRITISRPYISKAYGDGQPAISTYHESQVGEFVIGRKMDRYRMTTFGYYRSIIGTTPSGGPEYYVKNVQYISTIVPFTTGMITGYQPLGSTVTVHTHTGYDNRTPAGLNGVISLVRPRLVHVYVVPHDPNDPITKARSKLTTWRINFIPEPRGSAMLAVGLVALVGMYRRRRYSMER